MSVELFLSDGLWTVTRDGITIAEEARRSDAEWIAEAEEDNAVVTSAFWADTIDMENGGVTIIRTIRKSAKQRLFWGDLDTRMRGFVDMAGSGRKRQIAGLGD